MRFFLTILGIILAIWLVITIVKCDGTIPYCMGSALSTIFTEMKDGMTGVEP